MTDCQSICMTFLYVLAGYGALRFALLIVDIAWLLYRWRR